MKPIEIPKFRYLQDITRFLDKLDSEIDETGRRLTQQQKMLASVKAVDSKMLRASSMVFNVTPSDTKEQKSLVRKMRMKIDPELTHVVIPNIKKLESQYVLAEDLYDKYKVMESIETQLSLGFPNRRGPEYEATVNQINRMKQKIEEQLRLCFSFLNEVAEKHVPKQFQKYIQMIAELVNEHVIFKESHSFLYVSVDPEGDLMFTNYLMLQDVSNDEGSVAPHLYISIQWRLSKEPTISVDLNHEYEIPNKLIGTGQQVGSVGEAVKAIADMLELENFSSALGVVPLALQLNVDPSSLNPQLFSYRDFISKIIVDERSIGFRMRKELKNPEAVAEVAAQIYKELKGLMKSKNVRLTMKQVKEKGIYTLTFNIVKVAEGGEFNEYDMEFMRDKFNLNTTQLRKIVNIINNG